MTMSDQCACSGVTWVMSRGRAFGGRSSGRVMRVVERLPSATGSPSAAGARLDRCAPLGDVDDLDRERPLRTGADARRCLAEREPAVAHVALADHAALGVVLRHAVRTIPGAVLTADAGVGAVTHDAGDRILGVGVNRTALQTRRLEAVVAAHREIRAAGGGKPSAFDLADAPPVDRRRVAVLLVAGDDAALAADALPHVHVEAVLLAGGRARDRACARPRGSTASVE